MLKFVSSAIYSVFKMSEEQRFLSQYVGAPAISYVPVRKQRLHQIPTKFMINEAEHLHYSQKHLEQS